MNVLTVENASGPLINATHHHKTKGVLMTMRYKPVNLLVMDNTEVNWNR